MFKEIFNRKLMILLSICLIATLTIGILETVHAKDITIGPNTPGGLKKAIEDVKSDDTIFLRNGVYKGESNTNIFSNKSVKIYGLENNVILDGQGKNQILTILNGGASIKNLKFINGYSLNSGGAIFAESMLTVANCTFINNQAKNYGGAIVTLSESKISNSIFKANKAVFGGAITSADKLTLTNCKFNNNQVKTYGGAIYHERNNLIVTKSTFIKNQASTGGAIDTVSDFFNKIRIKDSTFKNNKAGFSGAINCLISTISGCTFINNKATDTSAINFKSDLTVFNCNFTNNKANNIGGAISGGYDDSSLTVNKCTFTNNKAVFGAGAIVNGAKKIKITNSKFKNNLLGKNHFLSVLNQGGKLTKKNVAITPKEGTKIKKK